VLEHALSRRAVMSSAAAAATLAAAGYVAPAAEAARASRRRLTVLATSDLHGNIFNWDYFKNTEYTDSASNDVGLAKVSMLVKAMRKERGDDRTLLLDNGDIIQGTPLDYYFAKVRPITEGNRHPMARVMNYLDYDAAVVGNHEFNYGIPLLRAFENQLEFPLLGANVHDDDTGLPVFKPYVIRRMDLGFDRPVRVGILGLTTPGSAIWDRANVEGRLAFTGVVQQARLWVPRMRRDGADVVIVLSHSGPTTSSSYGDALPYPENASSLIAEQVHGVDAIVAGHQHLEVGELIVRNKRTGRPVVITEPHKWGSRLSVIDLVVEQYRGRFRVVRRSSQVLNSNTVREDPAVVTLVGRQHRRVVSYVNSVIGTASEAMSAATARYEDVAAIDFINYVQADAVKMALAGTASAGLPVLSIAAPFNREAAIPAGDVSVRDVAGLYIYDNTLVGVTLTGAQVRDYLEKSAQYFKAQDDAGPVSADDVTNAPTTDAPTGVPDYNYDVMGGLDADLSYEIDLGEPVGSRIENLTYGGSPVDPAAEFVIAINNYRQSGGGTFPHVSTAPVLYNAQVEIRQLIIEWVRENGTIDPSLFASVDWVLTYQGTPLTITP